MTQELHQLFNQSRVGQGQGTPSFKLGAKEMNRKLNNWLATTLRSIQGEGQLSKT